MIPGRRFISLFVLLAVLCMIQADHHDHRSHGQHHKEQHHHHREHGGHKEHVEMYQHQYQHHSPSPQHPDHKEHVEIYQHHSPSPQHPDHKEHVEIYQHQYQHHSPSAQHPDHPNPTHPYPFEELERRRKYMQTKRLTQKAKDLKSRVDLRDYETIEKTKRRLDELREEWKREKKRGHESVYRPHGRQRWRRSVEEDDGKQSEELPMERLVEPEDTTIFADILPYLENLREMFASMDNADIRDALVEVSTMQNDNEGSSVSEEMLDDVRKALMLEDHEIIEKLTSASPENDLPRVFADLVKHTQEDATPADANEANNTDDPVNVKMKEGMDEPTGMPLEKSADMEDKVSGKDAVPDGEEVLEDMAAKGDGRDALELLKLMTAGEMTKPEMSMRDVEIVVPYGPLPEERIVLYEAMEDKEKSVPYDPLPKEQMVMNDPVENQEKIVPYGPLPEEQIVLYSSVPDVQKSVPFGPLTQDEMAAIYGSLKGDMIAVPYGPVNEEDFVVAAMKMNIEGDTAQPTQSSASDRLKDDSIVSDGGGESQASSYVEDEMLLEELRMKTLELIEKSKEMYSVQDSNKAMEFIEMVFTVPQDAGLTMQVMAEPKTEMDALQDPPTKQETSRTVTNTEAEMDNADRKVDTEELGEKSGKANSEAHEEEKKEEEMERNILNSAEEAELETRQEDEDMKKPEGDVSDHPILEVATWEAARTAMNLPEDFHGLPEEGEALMASVGRRVLRDVESPKEQQKEEEEEEDVVAEPEVRLRCIGGKLCKTCARYSLLHSGYTVCCYKCGVYPSVSPFELDMYTCNCMYF